MADSSSGYAVRGRRPPGTYANHPTRSLLPGEPDIIGWLNLPEYRGDLAHDISQAVRNAGARTAASQHVLVVGKKNVDYKSEPPKPGPAHFESPCFYQAFAHELHIAGCNLELPVVRNVVVNACSEFGSASEREAAIFRETMDHASTRNLADEPGKPE